MRRAVFSACAASLLPKSVEERLVAPAADGACAVAGEEEPDRLAPPPEGPPPKKLPTPGVTGEPPNPADPGAMALPPIDPRNSWSSICILASIMVSICCCMRKHEPFIPPSGEAKGAIAGKPGAFTFMHKLYEDEMDSNWNVAVSMLTYPRRRLFHNFHSLPFLSRGSAIAAPMSIRENTRSSEEDRATLRTLGHQIGRWLHARGLSLTRTTLSRWTPDRVPVPSLLQRSAWSRTTCHR